jgi:hypothetical protein
LKGFLADSTAFDTDNTFGSRGCLLTTKAPLQNNDDDKKLQQIIQSVAI